MQVGIQLYNFREALAADFQGTLRKVAALDADGVEFFCYGGMEPQALADLLGELNLKCAGTMFGRDELLDPGSKAWRVAEALKSPAVTVSDLRDFAAEWEIVCDYCREIGKIAAGKGLVFSYHNHWAEFVKTNGRTAMDWILESCDAEEVFMEPDICWLTRGGEDPAAFIRRYGKRIKQVHCKDIKQPEVPETTAELGQGVVNVPECLKAAKDIDAEWVIYEQDFTADPFVSAEKSLAYLKDQLRRIQ